MVTVVVILAPAPLSVLRTVAHTLRKNTGSPFGAPLPLEEPNPVQGHTTWQVMYRLGPAHWTLHRALLQ